VKVARTVQSGGKSEDSIKGLPIAIRCKITRNEAFHGEVDVTIFEKGNTHNSDAAKAVRQREYATNQQAGATHKLVPLAG